MVYDIKSRNLAFVHFLKFRDETMKELYLVTQEHDEIEKKCTKLTELEDKVIIIINLSTDLMKK